MTEIIQWARLDELSSTVTALTWPSRSFMYLERVPDHWLSEDERVGGLRLEELDQNVSFEAWERGRIFCETFELRWEKLDGAFRAVYVGPPTDLPGFALADEPDLSVAKSPPRSYYLWGLCVPDDQLETVGAPEGTDQAVFMEFKIPRLLLYPVSADARRVRLSVCEYLDPDTGDPCYYRFKELEEV